MFELIEPKTGGFSIPDGFMDWYLSKENSCDGCGTKWFSDIVPDSIYFVSIKLACCIHDYLFSLGGTREDFEYANSMFRDNLNAIVTLAGIRYTLYPTKLAKRRVETYYKAVSTEYAYKIFNENNKRIANEAQTRKA